MASVRSWPKSAGTDGDHPTSSRFHNTILALRKFNNWTSRRTQTREPHGPISLRDRVGLPIRGRHRRTHVDDGDVDRIALHLRSAIPIHGSSSMRATPKLRAPGQARPEPGGRSRRDRTRWIGRARDSVRRSRLRTQLGAFKAAGATYALCAQAAAAALTTPPPARPRHNRRRDYRSHA